MSMIKNYIFLYGKQHLKQSQYTNNRIEQMTAIQMTYIQGFYKSKIKYHQPERKIVGVYEQAVHREENANGF